MDLRFTPDYHDFVNSDEEMWIMQIDENTFTGAYNTVAEFKADIGQILKNCKTYHSPGGGQHRNEGKISWRPLFSICRNALQLHPCFHFSLLKIACCTMVCDVAKQVDHHLLNKVLDQADCSRITCYCSLVVITANFQAITQALWQIIAANLLATWELKPAVFAELIISAELLVYAMEVHLAGSPQDLAVAERNLQDPCCQSPSTGELHSDLSWSLTFLSCKSLMLIALHHLWQTLRLSLRAGWIKSSTKHTIFHIEWLEASVAAIQTLVYLWTGFLCNQWARIAMQRSCKCTRDHAKCGLCLPGSLIQKAMKHITLNGARLEAARILLQENCTSGILWNATSRHTAIAGICWWRWNFRAI